MIPTIFHENQRIEDALNIRRAALLGGYNSEDAFSKAVHEVGLNAEETTLFRQEVKR